jgi:ATP-dependent helicase HepA
MQSLVGRVPDERFWRGGRFLPGTVAALSLAVGNRGPTLDLLQKAVDERYSQVIFLNMDPRYLIRAFNPDLVAVSGAALRRRADEAFPVSYRTVWLTSDLEEVNDPELLAVLSQPYSKWVRTDGGRDLNLRSERWERAALLLSIGDWSELCLKARKSAEDKLRNGIELRSNCERHAARVRDSAANIANALSSRVGGLSGAVRRVEDRMAKMEAMLAEGLIAGIQNPVMRVDSAGVIVISGVPLESE